MAGGNLDGAVNLFFGGGAAAAAPPPAPAGGGGGGWTVPPARIVGEQEPADAAYYALCWPERGPIDARWLNQSLRFGADDRGAPLHPLGLHQPKFPPKAA